MSLGELFFIGIVILLVVPPEKLPGLAREAARLWNDIRRNTVGVWEEIKKDTVDPINEIRNDVKNDAVNLANQLNRGAQNLVNEIKDPKKEREEYLKMIGSPEDHGELPGHDPQAELAGSATTQPEASVADKSVTNESATAKKPN